ncbi:OLC1v1019969C3 [Oldenlandia corymbosa var. corymbosa]|nr:OLC1v1019969C3 [Oldenlandia corymbosa var. corymbosa]
MFGQNTNSVNRNPFAVAASGAPAGNPFGLTTTPAANSTGSNNNPFQPTSVFGQTNQASNPFSNSLGGSVANSSPFNTSSNYSFGNYGSIFGQKTDTNKGNNTFSFGGSSGTSSAFNNNTSSAAGIFSGNSNSGFGNTLSAPALATTTSSLFTAALGPSHGNGGLIFGQTNSATSSKNAFGITAGPQITATKYVPTPSEDGPQFKIVSISAMHNSQSKSHEELRFEDHQLSVDKGSKSTSTLAPAASIGTWRTFLPTAPSSVASGSNFPSNTNPSSNFQSQQQPSSTMFPGTGFPSNVSSSTSSGVITSQTQYKFPSNPVSQFSFQTQPTVSNTMSTGTGSQGTLGTGFNFPSQPQPNPSSTPSMFPSSVQPVTSNAMPSVFSFQTQPQAITSSAPSMLPSPFQPVTSNATPSGLSFQTQPQAITSSAPSMFTSPVQPITSNAASTGLGPWNQQFPSSPSPVLTPQGQPQSPMSNFPSTGTSPIQTSTPTVLTWAKPPTTQTTAGNHSITNSIFQQPPSGSLKSDIHNQNSISIPTVANPFGEKSTVRTTNNSQISSISVHGGISSMTSEKPTSVKRVSMLSARNLTLSRTKLSFQKYKPKDDGQKVPFYEEKSFSSGKVSISLNPRQNPRAWVLNPSTLDTRSTRSALLEEVSSDFETGISNDNTGKHTDSAVDGNFDDSARNQTVPNDYAASVDALLPKLQSPDYYVIPPIQELAARERVEPGFCSHVKDFVVGRKGYGSIKFLREIDVRNLDLESLIKFKNREVLVYPDESKKPQVGKGLNKPAEITLLNIKCIDKATGKQYVDGPKVDRGREMLMKKAADQGVEFVSYEPAQGEWKFRVQHF